MSFTSGIALALAAVLSASSGSTVVTQPVPQAQTVQQYVETYFADEPVMIEIARCESQFTQTKKDGSIVTNPKSSAIGIFQIMSSIHSSFADKKLGIDIYTIQGNAAYAQYLYDKQGTVPWNASKSCWGKTDAALALAK